MSILLRQVKIIDPSSPFHQQQADIFIDKGFISNIGSINLKADHIIEAEGLHVSPGWVDVFSNFCDPGLEYKETLETGAEAAARGGYTDVFVIPNTSPTLHNKSVIEYVAQKSRSLPVNVHPIAAITKNTEGKELAEMYDMHQSGAIAFSDGTASIQSPGILLKALQYVKAIDKTIIQLPNDRSVSNQGLMNEGIICTQLGLPGIPAIGEELMIMRDIEIVKYTGSKLHITGITTAKSVVLIKKAKEEGVHVTCSVTPAHLFFTDEDLQDYDTNLKLDPPLRTKEDKHDLINGLLDGTIDCIASHHLPEDTDHKMVEFEYARPGMISLQTCFSVIRTAVPQLSLELLVNLLSIQPRKIFDLPAYSINKNEKAGLTLFLPDENRKIEKLHSKSKNSALIGKTVKGRVLGIINKDKLFLNE